MKKPFFLILIACFPLLCAGQGSGRCLSINEGGAPQYITADNMLENFSFDELSITVWVKPTASNSHGGAIFAFNELSGEFTNNVNLVYFKDDHFEYFDRNPNNFNIPTSGYFPPGNWYHVALVIDEDLNGKIYINGVERLSFDALEVPVAGDRFSIGQEWDAFDISGLYQGQVDELRVWNKALTQQQIWEEMCRKIPPTDPDLVAYYNFDDTTTGNSLADLTANGNDGELITFDANDFVLSGAPIGDDSVFKYNTNWANETVAYEVAQDKYLQVSQVGNSPEGVHLYYVQSNPNTWQGIELPQVNEYFGVFCTNLNATFSVEYGFGGYGFPCFDCDKTADIFSRNDNAISSWSDISAALDISNCLASKVNESSIGLSARAEYIIGKKSESSNVSILPETVSFCQGTSLMLNAEHPSGQSYLWSDGSTAPTLTVSSVGQYWVEIIFQGGCVESDTTAANVAPPPTPFNLAEYDTLCLGDTIVIEAPAEVGVNYLWHDASTLDHYLVTGPQTVGLILANACGEASDETTINFEDCDDIYVANAFSPNFDGINDFFGLMVERNRTLQITSMKIFDRWGGKLFDRSNFPSNPISLGWDGDVDGKPASAGIYVYLIEVLKPGGQKLILSGDFTLLR
jgi:gliding motility-associated-like protein